MPHVAGQNIVLIKRINEINSKLILFIFTLLKDLNTINYTKEPCPIVKIPFKWTTQKQLLKYAPFQQMLSKW